jgi:hypothetical protein
MREASCAMRSSLGVVYEHLLSSGSVLVLYLGCAPLPCRPFVVCLGDGAWGVFDDDETIYVGYISVLVSDAVPYLVIAGQRIMALRVFPWPASEPTKKSVSHKGYLLLMARLV